MAPAFEIFNVGQGLSALVSFNDSNNTRMLIDLHIHTEKEDDENAPRAGVNVVEILKRKISKKVIVNGKEKRLLDYFVVSHPHEDHIQGIKELRKEFEIGELWESSFRWDSDSEDYKEFVKLAEELKKKGRLLKLHGKKKPIKTIDNTAIYCFSPINNIDSDEEETNEEIHDACSVLKFECENFATLFPGDSEHQTWREIVPRFGGNPNLLKSNVLIASHHGSRTFFKDKEEDTPYEEGINKISPNYVIISSIEPNNNSTHPPHKDAIELYEKKCGKENIHSTYKCGEVTIRKNQDNIWAVNCEKHGGDSDNGGEGSRVAPVILGSDRKTKERVFGEDNGI